MHLVHRGTSQAVFVLPEVVLDLHAWWHFVPAVYSSAEVDLFEHEDHTRRFCALGKDRVSDFTL